MVPHLTIMPSIGGSSISAKNTSIAIKYAAYLMLFFDESASKAAGILGKSIVSVCV
jgi:hypothetical protein